jgi:hypothetical protein
MGQGNKVSQGAIQGDPLRSHLPLRLHLYLDELRHQHLDSLVNVGTQALHTGSCGSVKAQPGYTLQHVKSALV